MSATQKLEFEIKKNNKNKDVAGKISILLDLVIILQVQFKNLRLIKRT